MMSHDAVKLAHSHDNMTLAYIYSKGIEQSSRAGAGGAFPGASSDDVDDVDVHALWGNFKGLLGENSSTSAYLVLLDIDCNSIAANCAEGSIPALSGAAVGSADFYTIGARQAGGLGDFSYRGEFYYQTGKSGIAAPTGGTGDLGAYMVGLRAGYKASNVPMKPSITLWFDYLSGSDASDLAAGDFGTFNTLFDTGHKYYGLQDFFIHGTTGLGSHPLGGLIDYAVKLSVQPMAKTTLKLDWHLFMVAEDDVCGDCLANGGSGPNSSTLGNEIDITLVHKYSPSTKIMVGYSHMFANDLLSNYNGALAGPNVARTQNFEDSDWLYVMFDVMF
jgi:Alginate export